MALPAVLSDLRLPVVCAPMFIVSSPELVIAQSTSGVVGSIPALNARPASLLPDWLDQIDEGLAAYDAQHPGAPSAPFAVNHIVHRSNARLEEDLAVTVEHQVPITITSLGAREDVNEAVHSYGGLVLHDVTTNRFARKAIEKGADGLIAVAAGAGGHAGTQSPFALIREIREWFDGPLLLSGAIGHGSSILAAQAAGADLAYVGSAFIASTEAVAPDAYKRMVVDSTAGDIVYSDLFTGVHGNYLRGSIEAAGLDPAALPVSDSGSVDIDAKAWKDIWGAGQGVGSTSTVESAAAIVARLSEQYDAARKRMAAL